MIVLIVALLALSVLGGLLYTFIKGVDAEVKQEDAQQAQIPARGVNRMQAGMRRRRAGGRAAAEEIEEEEEAPAAGTEDGPIKRKDAYEARRAARDAEREALEEAQEEEIRRAAEERRKKEEEEAAKWMGSFTVEGAGEDALTKEDDEALASRMIEYIQQRKTVGMEELAAEFSLKTADAIVKVQELEAEGRITGVMDDRGKFIYVGREEMAAVADYIRSQGRVSIADLATKSNMFIDLAPKEVETGSLLELDSVLEQEA